MIISVYMFVFLSFVSPQATLSVIIYYLSVSQAKKALHCSQPQINLNSSFELFLYAAAHFNLL